MASIGPKLPKMGSSEQRCETHHSISSMVLFCYEIFLITASRLEHSFKWQISGGEFPRHL